MYNNDKEKKDVQELNLEDLEYVTGGGAFDDVPRVPENPIDDNLKKNA